MLTAIIHELKDRQEPLSLRAISQKFGLDESAVEGMMEILIRKGLVRDHSRIMEEGNRCAYCSLCRDCSIKKSAMANLPKIYSIRSER